MAVHQDDEQDEGSEAMLDERTPPVSRAQSNYSTRRTKLTIAPTKYGETRAGYLWRLLSCSIRQTIDAVSRADDTDIERSHGLHFMRQITSDRPVKCIAFNIKRKEIVSIDRMQIARLYHSDGRLIRKRRVDVTFDELFYCANEDEFIGWSHGKKELHIFSDGLEILSTSTCHYDIAAFAYNEMTSDLVTCGRGGVTVWQFRYNRRHIIAKFECREGFQAEADFHILAMEQTHGAVQRLFVTSGYDILTFNIADGGRLLSTKDDLHVRPIVAMIFVEQRNVLVTAGRDGSIKVWDHRWFILFAYVGHHDRVLCLSKHPFGPYVISTSSDRTLRVWSLEYGDVVDVIHLSEPILQMNVTRGYEKFIAMSTKGVQLWCVKHYCDFLSLIGSPILKITCTTHPDYPIRSTLLCQDSTVRIVACTTGDVLTSLVCDLNFQATSCAYAIGENILFVSNGRTLLKADTSVNPSRIVQQIEITEYSIQCLLMYEYVAKQTMEETPMLKGLVTKPSSDLIHLALKGFSRTLLIAGLSNGCVAVLKWNTGTIDYALDMHSTRPVVDLIAHSDADQIISCGEDLTIRVWRVFPYATESLSVLRSIFCGLPPIHLTVMRNSLAVAFRDDSTFTHSLMLYNLENNERFDHGPENDHCDRISAISGCSKLKLIATGSLDGTLRIWNSQNQLIRMIIIHDRINSLQFSNDSGDLVLGIGDHLYSMSHLSYLPKLLVFKIVGMQFAATVPESKESEEIDQAQLARMPSADLVRLQRAHKAEAMSAMTMGETAHVDVYHAQSVEQIKAKDEALAKLEKRDLEIVQIAEGQIHSTTKHKVPSKVRQEAFNEYMKMYLKEPKKGLLDDDLYKLTEDELFGPSPPPPPPIKSDPCVVARYDHDFFPSLKDASQDPLSSMYAEREQTLTNLKECYVEQQPATPKDHARHTKHQQEKHELKKLLDSNLQKITLPMDRLRYGPGSTVPNSVLARLLWPKRELKVVEQPEWSPPSLTHEQLALLEKKKPVSTAPVQEEDTEWIEITEEALNKKFNSTNEDDLADRFEEENTNDQSDFVRESTQQDIHFQLADASDEETADQIFTQSVHEMPPVVKSTATPKSRQASGRVLPSSADESTQTAANRIKTPRQFSPAFLRLIDKLESLNWFEEQYPSKSKDSLLENCDETFFPIDVFQRLDSVQNIDHRLLILQELENFYRTHPMNDLVRETLVQKILFHLTKYNPADNSLNDEAFISIYLQLLAQINKMTIDVIAEWIYWYLEGGHQIRPIVKSLFEQCGLDDPLGYFYAEMDSWKLWELDDKQPRRVEIKTLANEWLRQWTRAFRTHIEELQDRLKNGDVHVQISNATSRALNGDTSLSTRSSGNGKNVTVTLNTLPRSITKNISCMEAINYFVEVTHDELTALNRTKTKTADNTILVLPKINKPAAVIRLGESHTEYHRPVKRHPVHYSHEHRFEPGELTMGRYMNYPLRKLYLDPFRRQIFTEDVNYEDGEPHLLTLKLAPKFFLPTLSQVTKSG